MYIVEFQKRGLPHAHIMLFMHPSCKTKGPTEIDNVISAEISDKDEDPKLYQVVKDCMIHGPCGAANPNSSCMADGACSKFSPRLMLILRQLIKMSIQYTRGEKYKVC